MKDAYRAVGLLGVASIVALIVGALVQHFSASLPGSYTWFEPVRTLRIVWEHEWTPASFLLVYLLGLWRVSRGGDGGLGDLVRVTPRMFLYAIGLGCADALLVPQHNGFDVAAMVACGLIIARQQPSPRARVHLVGHMFFAGVAFGAICYSFSVTKALTLVGRQQVDPALVDIEHAVFGVVLHRAIAAWASTRPALVILCDAVYFRLFQHMALTTMLLMGMRQRKERFEYLGALAFCYLLGGPLYHVFPGVGPSYYDQEAFAYMNDLPLATNEIRAWLFHNTQQVLSGDAEVIRTWGYVACMPSLHIAHELVMLYYARRSKVALGISSVFTATTLVAVVVLGWHYAIDAIGGLLLAATAIAIAKWQRDWLMPAALAPEDDESLPPRRTLRAWLADLRAHVPVAALPHVTPRTFRAIAVGALVVRVIIAFGDLTQTDQQFVPDGAYSSLSIARSLAHGLGPTADGVTPTSGFEPLLAFLTVPAFWLTTAPILPFVWVLLLSIVADTASVWLLGRLATRLGGPLAGLCACAIWATSPLAIANALDGVETALALACELAFLEAWALARERDAAKWHWLTGIAAGAAMLARLDAVILVAAVTLVALVRMKDRAPLLARVFGGAVIVVAPWWLYATLRFGSPVPETAGALHAFLPPVRWARLFGWLGGALAGGAFADLPRLRSYLFAHEALGVIVATGVLGTLALALRRPAREPLLRALVVHAVAILILYLFWLPAIGSLRRCLEPAYAAIAVAAALAAASAFASAPAPFGRRLAGGVGVVLILGFGLGGVGRAFRGTMRVDERGLNGPKGYAGAAREVMDLVPEGAIVGTFQSGALGYFARPGVRVVDLSGLVDRDAREAVMERKVLDYAAKCGVTHIADFRSNMERLRFLSAASAHGIQAEPVGQASPQGSDTMSVYAVRLPTSP